MASKYIVLAGPQAAGKSTILNCLGEEYKDALLLQESRQIVVHERKRLGAIFMTRNDELEVMHRDIQRMFRILDEQNHESIHIDETNVFTLSHARAHGIDLMFGYQQQYLDMLHRLNACVLFIDVPPTMSWVRRKASYEKRLMGLGRNQRETLLHKYQQYLIDLHPELHNMFSQITVPKLMIDGAAASDDVLRSASLGISHLIQETDNLAESNSPVLDGPLITK